MPELPEVRTVVAFLKQFKNQTLKKIETHLPSMFSHELAKALEKNVIIDVTSLGKYIIFHLSEYDLISHLRMEGKYYFKEAYEKTKHDHVIFHLDKGYLYYNDTRKFGTFDLKKGNTYNTPPLSKLGKEPFDVNLKALHETFKKSNRFIKTLLLDQHIISGIGNIYANEILFAAKINPKTRGSKLTLKQTKTLLKESIRILNEAIKKGGTTIHSFSSNEVEGWFQLDLFVHTKNDKPCKVCQTLIKKEKINGRMSYYCEHCQR